MSVTVLTEKIPLRNFAAQLQGQRINLWANLHRENDILANELLKFQIPSRCL